MVGLKIKEYLDENGIKYSYLSERAGMPMNILSPTLNGKRKMSAEEYFMICEILGLPAETFAPDKKVSKQSEQEVFKVWVPKWYWESAVRRQEELERRVKRLELILLKEAENKIASLSDKEAGKEYRDGYLAIEEIVNQGIKTRRIFVD